MVTENEETFNFGLQNNFVSFSTNNRKLMNDVRKDLVGTFETHKELETCGTMRIIETDMEFPIEVPKYAIREFPWE